jgi:hypothetical protein
MDSVVNQAFTVGMDENLKVLLILGGVAVAVSGIVVILQSRRIRTYGIIGALRRKLSGGSGRSPYSG